MFGPPDIETWSQRRDRSDESFLAELRADLHREQREEARAQARERTPRMAAVVDLLGGLWRAHDYPTLEGLLLGSENVERFERHMSRAVIELRCEREIAAEDAEKLARWAWPFVMHEEAMVSLSQRIESDAESRMGAASNAA